VIKLKIFQLLATRIIFKVYRTFEKGSILLTFKESWFHPIGQTIKEESNCLNVTSRLRNSTEKEPLGHTNIASTQ